MKLRKVMAVSLAAAMALSMTACGGGSSQPAETPAPTEAAAAQGETKAEEAADAATEAAESVEKAVEGKDPAEIKVGISIYQFADNFMTLYRTELENYLVNELGLKKENISIMDGKNDQGEQMNQIRNFITQGCDVLIVNLVQASSEPTVTEECAAEIGRAHV